VSDGKTFFDVYTEEDPKGVVDFLDALFPDLRRFDYSVAHPSLNWPLETGHSDGSRVRVPELVVSLIFSDEDRDHLDRIARDSENSSARLYADPVISLADHWCPTRPDQTQFGTRSKARRLIGAEALGTTPQLPGEGVNVVIVDAGLNGEWIETHFGRGRFGGGWKFKPRRSDPRPPQCPGQTGVKDAEHGLMIARNILDIAPAARIYDLPLLPPRITNIPVFLDEAQAAYNSMLNDVYQRGGTWLLVNAWAIFDRRTEVPPGSYTENSSYAEEEGLALHAFTQKVADAIDHKIDVIFCAGNCGQFCPDERCGGMDQGPGRSIWGANSYYRVLTIGAVRVDGAWIGYSSQGPGQPRLGAPSRPGINRKPDLCFPSGFAEDFDVHTLNRGTSAATAVAAGVVAALRSRWGPQAVKPELMQLVLKATARLPLSGSWDPRLGNGIPDIPAVLAMLQ
jgi:hypothetical protein